MELSYKLIPAGTIDGKIIPLDIVFIDKKDIEKAGISAREAVSLIAKEFLGPVGMNVFDMDAVTTTSDGIMINGAIVLMAAADSGKINSEFGILHMAEIEYSEEIISEEPHLKQWEKKFKGKKLYRGPDPKTKIIPVHNVCITGRASNNNSATEMMNIVTMEEILLPILGQKEIMENGNIVFGRTGEVISVGIGMTVAEKFGRVFPTRQFKAGDTAHGCGEYAKTLKKDIPCIVADKKALANAILSALDCGCVPGKDIGCSPAVLFIAKAAGAPIDFENITPVAYEELKSIGITKEELMNKGNILTKEEILNRAEEIIPGVEDGKKYAVSEFVKDCFMEI